MGNVERGVIDQREAERRDLITRRKSDDDFRFKFTGAGDVTGFVPSLRIYDRPGGTLLKTEAPTTTNPAAPDPTASFEISAADKQGLANDDASDTVVYFYEVEIDLPDLTIWFNGDLVVNP